MDEARTEVEIWRLSGRSVVGLDGDRVTVGKAKENDIALDGDATVSRLHAVLERFEAGWCVSDLGSSNGTYVNGRRVQQAFLNPGDELKLDTVRFIVVAPGLEMTQQTARLAKPESAAANGAPPQALSKWVPIMLVAAALVVIVALVLNRG